METGIYIAKTIVPQIPSAPLKQYHPENARTEAMQLQCEVMFGSPSSNCGGNGICKIVAKSIYPKPVFERTSCSHAKAIFTAWGDDKDATLIFRRDWLCSNLMRRHFRHGILEMAEPCPLPPWIVKTLGLKISELPAGMHLIEDYGSYLKIHFTIPN